MALVRRLLHIVENTGESKGNIVTGCCLEPHRIGSKSIRTVYIFLVITKRTPNEI